ncbi:gamma-mobile-trio integrase GmtZ, partial [Pseudoalteromonas nigrifaciens]
MATKTTQTKKKHDSRTTDLTLQWLVNNHGQEWETWRQLGEEWITNQDSGTATKLESLCIFLDVYLVGFIPWTSDVVSLFIGKNNWQASTDELKRVVLEKTNRSDNSVTARTLNHCKKFIDWVLEAHFSEKDDNGKAIRLYANPFEQIKTKANNTESVHNPLPYRYICDLRHILCPKPSGYFSDWQWAQENSFDGNRGGDWFDFDESLIDKTDKDCVWRIKEVTRNGKQVTVHQIWSPVASMVLFIKLHLPLRTYQVRMLDSGEADTFRYENGEWIKNPHNFALNRYSKGVFRQFKDNATGLESTGLYISTNKTADQNKDEFERGYEIPWQNEDVLYWLEKLRNWQERYNPIDKPLDCTSLTTRHTDRKTSHQYLSAMGHSCFLFRDPASKNKSDRSKPIPKEQIQKLWYKLLKKLEINLLASGCALSNGSPLKLVHDYGNHYKKSNKKKTEFPLHSLRVSLITCYIMDAKLPLSVVSKLLAGHSRIIMTVYYTKLTPAVMKDKMTEADKLLDDKSQESVRTFLKDAEMRQIECKMAYNDGQSIEMALVNRNPIGWENRHHGLCLAGGNTVRSDECATVAGCWNGGELVATRGTASDVYSSVSHGSENCVRCRWFITDARYLPALNAHLNFMSYKSHEAANLAVKLEGEIEVMDDLKYEAEYEGKPFTKHNELQALH